MRYFVCFLFLMQAGLLSSRAQIRHEGVMMGIKIENGDTVYLAKIEGVDITTRRVFKSKADEKAFWRLVYNVKRTYPYAKLAAVKLQELNEQYLELDSERQRKQYARKVEEELKNEFEGELRKLTISQGRILLRLVDRETGSTTYAIVKDFRGTVSAIFWQTVAKLFGSNLKTQYDASKGEDKIIEQIIRQIEAGYL
ncbi:MAG: DUF4294 domain-containing protein [Bacteroidales bacterium]|jgi:hypothetical protein|nr:DUF4294 domain-containing protein [Bacteroidales bacterium]